MSWDAAVVEAIRLAQRNNITVPDEVKRRVATPEGLVSLMREIADRSVAIANKVAENARTGQLLPRDVEILTRSNASVYLTQKKLYEAIASVPGALAATGLQPPPDPARAQAPRSSGLSGPEVLLVPVAAGGAAASGMAIWIALAAAVAVYAALALLAIGTAAALIYVCFGMYNDTRRFEVQQQAATRTNSDCLAAGSSPEECAALVERLHPLPPPAADPFSAFALAAIPVVGGLALLGIAAYVIVGVTGRGGGGGTVVFAPQGRASDGSIYYGPEKGRGVETLGWLLGTAGVVGVLWYTLTAGTPRRTAPSGAGVASGEAPTGVRGLGGGDLRAQLYGRGSYGTSGRDTPERLSYGQFVSRRGPSYDLEVK